MQYLTRLRLNRSIGRLSNNTTVSGVNIRYKTDSSSEIAHYGRKKQTNVSLKALMETGMGKRLDLEPNLINEGASSRVRIQIACFLHRELPIRLAHRVLELEQTPEFSNNKHVQQVISW